MRKKTFPLLFAEIILPLSLPRTLTYGVPENLQTSICKGIRVEVSFGKNKTYAGLVYQLHDHKPDAFSIKKVRRILDRKPVVSELQLEFWAWVAAYYCCTLGDVMQAALPAHLKLMNDSVIVWNPQILSLPDSLSNEGYLLAEALQIRKKLTIEEIRLITEDKNYADAITEVLDYNLAFVEEGLKEKYYPKLEKCVSLNSTYVADQKFLKPVFDSLKDAPKQSELLLHFFQMRQKDKEVGRSELLKKTGASAASLNALVQKGVLEVYTKEISRLISYNQEEVAKPVFKLNEEQEEAYQSMLKQWEQKRTILLQGVTGSGKTMIYIRLIEEQIKKNRQSLLLLPEIALTTHFVHRLQAHFGSCLGVYHSRFSNNERVEIWNKVKSGEFKIIMGARSALWLPFKDLAQIIVDEEHETSYKQQNPAPRFQARDAAIFLASLQNCRVLLGSATPSLESAYNVEKGKFGYAALKKRYQNQAMPEVKVVKAGNLSPALSAIITIPLLEAIQQAFSEGKQVLLFQNKRGYAPFLICSVCGYVPHCPNCDVSLTYHKADDRLHCHYCGQKSQPITHCPQCGHNKIKARSFGTEKIEEELQRIFPKRKTARMDTDSIRGKNRLSQLIRDFERGGIDILVGTQMIAKGLDFENVGLVGILSADSLWSHPNFRVNERAFQLMEQVSGRAGRTLSGRGQVLIQAFKLDHPLLPLVIKHDFKGFYRLEIQFRKQFNYPPFFKLIQLTIKHRKQEKAATAADFLSNKLVNLPQFQLQGPTTAAVARIKSFYLFELRLKIPLNQKLLSQQKNQVLSAIQEMQSLKGFSGVRVVIDVDPN